MLNIAISSPVKISSGNFDNQTTLDASTSGKPEKEKFGQILAKEISNDNAQNKMGVHSDVQEVSQSASDLGDETSQVEPDSATRSQVPKIASDLATRSPMNLSEENLLPGVDQLDADVSGKEETLQVLPNSAAIVASDLSGKNLLPELNHPELVAPISAFSNVINNAPDKNPGVSSLLSGKINLLIDPQNSSLHGFTNVLENNELDSFNTKNLISTEKFQSFIAGIDSASRFGSSKGESALLSASEINQPAGSNNLASVFSPAVSSPSAINSHSIMSLDVPIGQPKWAGEFSQKIVWLSNQQQTSAEIRLNPAHLGPIDVMLSMSKNEHGTQEVMVQFASNHLVAREAIEAALPKLREMMMESGIILGNVSVGADSFQQQAETRQREGGASANNSQGTEINQPADDKLEKQMLTSRHNGVVNTFA